MKNENILKRILTILFSILYLSVGFVSVYHAVNFFTISNQAWLATILAIAFEIGQGAILFYLLISKDKKVMPWILMSVSTLVQVFGNIYSSYQYMLLHNSDLIQYFTNSVLFFMQDPNPQVNHVMISYITGAILPIVALCMTSMIVDSSGLSGGDATKIKPNDQDETDDKESISKIVY